MKKRAIIAVVLLGISGCVSFSDINKGVNSFLGKNIDYAVNRIGYPTSEREFQGRKLYVWGNAQDVTLYLPQTAQTTGNVYGTYGSATYQGTTTYNAPTNIHYECTVILEVDDQGIVRRTQWNGNRGGCARYAKFAGN